MNGVLAGLAIAAGLVQSAPTSPKWERDYGVALKSARSGKRPLVVVLENPNAPEQSLKTEGISHGSDQAKMLEAFVLCRVDVTTKIGRMVAEAFGAREFPYTAITDRDCRKIIHRHAGRPTAQAWVAMLAQRLPRLGLRLETAKYGDAPVWQETCFT